MAKKQENQDDGWVGEPPAATLARSKPISRAAWPTGRCRNLLQVGRLVNHLKINDELTVEAVNRNGGPVLVSGIFTLFVVGPPIF